MAIKRKFVTMLLAATLAIFIGSGIASASDDESKNYKSETVIVAQSETHDGALYATGQLVTVAGTVKGDVYCAAQTVTITGTVQGDVICGAQNIRIDGTVTGDVRVAAQTVSFDGAVSGSATAFAQTIDVSKDAVIGTDFTGGAVSIVIAGKIGRDILGASETMTINGNVGRNVGGEYDQLTVSNEAVVEGTLRYTSNQDATVASGSVKGEVARTTPAADNNDSDDFWTGGAVYFFFSTLLISLVIALIASRFVHTVTDNGVTRFFPSLLVGFFVVVGTPFVLILLAMTVIGLPLAGLAFLVWLLLLLLSGPVFGYYLGRVIMQNRTNSSLLIMLIGSTVLILSYFVPLLNVIAVIAALTVGSGMMVLALVGRYQKPARKVKK